MIEYNLIRSKRKTISLAVTGQSGVVVKAPLRMPVVDIESFIHRNSDWIEKRRACIQERIKKSVRIAFDDDLNAKLKQKAAEHLPQRTAYFGDIMGVLPAMVKITSAITRWGSCSGKNVICYTYRLMLLPPDLIDYIIVHELTHIRIKNHSAMFYREMEKYMPDYVEKENRLRLFIMNQEYMEFVQD